MAANLGQKMLGALRLACLVISIFILTLTSYLIYGVDLLARFLVKTLEKIAGVVIESEKMIMHGQRVHNKPIYEVPKSIIDLEASLKCADFPFRSEQLIAKAKHLTSKEVQLGAKSPDLLADDYQFVFPVVGPLNKTEFCTVFGGFKVGDAFPNAADNFFGFTVDPMEPNRVWFFARPELKHEGTLKFGKLEFPATNKIVTHTPQAFSFSFDHEGRCFKMTGGYPIDRTIGNAGGLGGLFGIIYAIGGSLPLGPESKPWKPSLEWEAWAKRVGQLTKEWRKMSN